MMVHLTQKQHKQHAERPKITRDVACIATQKKYICWAQLHIPKGRWSLWPSRGECHGLMDLARVTHKRVFTTDNFMVLSHFLCRSIRPPRIITPAPIAGSGVVRRLLVERFRFGLLRDIEHTSHIQLLASGLNPDCDAPNSAGMSALTPVRDATLVFARPGARNAA